MKKKEVWYYIEPFGKGYAGYVRKEGSNPIMIYGKTRAEVIKGLLQAYSPYIYKGLVV